jgi:hypothetical protein
MAAVDAAARRFEPARDERQAIALRANLDPLEEQAL